MMKAKLKKVISLVSEMDEARLDALLLLLQEPVGGDYDLTADDKWIIQERAARYDRGEDKGVPAKEATKRIRTALKKRRK
jgi:hypothetical protein